jgi:hypothetical protein
MFLKKPYSEFISVMRNRTEESHNIGRAENIRKAVSAYATAKFHVDLHCQAMNSSCCDMRIPLFPETSFSAEDARTTYLRTLATTVPKWLEKKNFITFINARWFKYDRDKL